jgi:hypothetical protein
MTLRSLLHDKKTTIVKRWLDSTFATYSGETASFLGGTRDRFSNPVGHALRTGTQGIYENLLEGLDPETVCRHLEEIIKIRAIQDLTPSRAVSFVFLLKEAVRAELGDEVLALAAELGRFESDVDQVALFAFDVYTRCREKLSELRINEIKRSVAGIMDRFRNGEEMPDPKSSRRREGR